MTTFARGPLRAFRSRDYSLYWVASVLSIMSHMMLFIFRGWLALELTDSAFMVAAVATAGELPSLILSMPGGILADRISRRAILIGAEAVTVVILVVFALLLALDQITIWHVFVLTALAGAAFAIGIPARTAIVPNLVPREDIANGVALSSIMFSGGMLVGPATAGWLLASAGPSVGFLVAAAVSVVSVAFFLPVHTGQAMRTVDRSLKSLWTDTTGGLAYVRHHRLIFGLMMIAFIAIVFGSPYQAMLPVFARDILDSGELGLGILGATGGAGAIIGSMAVAWLNRPVAIRRFIIWGALGFGFFIVAFALSTMFWLSALMAIGAGFSFQVILVASTARVQIVAEDAMRGRVSAVRAMTWGAAPFGFMILGTMAEFLGTPTATAVMGGVTVGLSLLVIIGFSSLRRIGHDDDDGDVETGVEAGQTLPS